MRNLIVFGATWFWLFVGTVVLGQTVINESEWEINRDSVILHGTLSTPSLENEKIVILFISGSGLTDRNGNNPFLKNNSLKGLSDYLVFAGYTTLRYDKRGIGASKNRNINESSLRFDDFVSDASAWCKKMKDSFPDYQYVIAGHSQGSLIAILVAQREMVDGLISLAGTGRPIDKVIHEQLEKQMPALVSESDSIAALIKSGQTVADMNPILSSIYRPGVQPFLRSWMKYDPAKEIGKLHIPIIIIQGEKDLQVTEEDAQLLHKTNPSSTIGLIPEMNHILKDIQGGPSQNQQSYNDPNLPISSELLKSIKSFLKKLLF